MKTAIDDLSPEQLQTVKITLNSGTREYVGTHGDVDFLPKEKLAGLKVEEALVLRRTSQLRERQRWHARNT